jgi:transcriptional regulator with XRE-family HTH domain
MRDIGKNIRTLRERRQLTQEALAEKLFVTRQTVSNYETGRSRPDIDTLVNIAAALDADVNTLIYGVPISRRGRQLRRLLWGGAALALTGLAWAVLAPMAKAQLKYYAAQGAYLLALTVRPLFYLLLGWCALQGLACLARLRPLEGPRIIWARRGLIILLAAVAALELPYLLWLSGLFFKDTGGGGFPQIPLYTPLVLRLTLGILRFPWLYGLWGAGLWLTGFPRARKIETET